MPPNIKIGKPQPLNIDEVRKSQALTYSSAGAKGAGIPQIGSGFAVTPKPAVQGTSLPLTGSGALYAQNAFGVKGPTVQAKPTPTPPPAPPQSLMTPSGNQVTFTPQGAPQIQAQSFAVPTGNVPSDIFSQPTTMQDVEKKRSQYQDALVALQQAQQYSPEYIDSLKQTNAIKARDAELRSNLITGNNLPGSTLGYAQQYTSREQALNDITGLRASQDLAVQQAIRSGNIEAAKAALEASKPQSIGAGQSFIDPISGQIISTAPTQSFAEYQDALRSGFRGTFNDYQTADANRKAAQLGASGLSPTQTQNFLRISDKYQADPFIANANKGATAIQIADQVLANPTGAGNQLKALYTLVKNLDPDSAVREGEVDLAQKTQSYFDKFATDLTRVITGQVVSPSTAKLLATATKELAQAWFETAKRRETQYISQAQIAGIGQPFDEYLGGFQRPYSAPTQEGGYIDPSQATW